MRLEDLYQNFGRSSPEDQQKYIAEYRLRRSQDLESVQPSKKSLKTSSSTKAKIVLTEEEQLLMTTLGLKQKDIAALRALKEEPVKDDDKDGVIFKDDTYEEEDDE